MVRQHAGMSRESRKTLITTGPPVAPSGTNSMGTSVINDANEAAQWIMPHCSEKGAVSCVTMTFCYAAAAVPQGYAHLPTDPGDNMSRRRGPTLRRR
jgi:hypothetical protein